VADCSAGCRTCQADSTWSQCSAGKSCDQDPEVETCDGKDNDCSGVADDMEAHEIAADCEAKLTVTASHVAAWGCDRACRVETCDASYLDRNGDPSDGCEFHCSPSAPGAEVCDGEDNDCDGTVDNVADLNADCSSQVTNRQHVSEWVCSGAGTCEVGRCEAGWSDLNDTGDDGCEEACVPDPPERCDGRDDDCDGLADNPGAEGCSAFFRDEDKDGVGVAGDSQCLCAAAGSHTATTSGDCNDEDANNWSSCGSCADGDEDTHYLGCDAYVTVSGPDCNDNDANNWSSCDTCADGDEDSHYTGCDAYVTVSGADCNDEDVNNWSGCDTCADGDEDTHFSGCDAYVTVSGPDCNDGDVNNWSSCDTCADGDNDSHYAGCDVYATVSGPDCNDEDANNWSSCDSCADGDADSYFSGCDAYVTVSGPDCNDGNGAVHPGATEGPQGDATCNDTEDNDCDTRTNNQDTDCWWDQSWGRRIRLTLDNAAQAEDLVDFPVLVVLDRFRVDLSAIQDSGQDLRFIAADGSELSYEIEKWDEGSNTTWVFEAESPDTERSLDGTHNWETRDALVGYSRAGYKEALPNATTNCNNDPTDCGAELTFDFTVPEGRYYPHFRINAASGGDDSLHWGVGGLVSDDLRTSPTDGTWAWDTGGRRIDASAGTFTLYVWMREDGQKLDQIVLSDSGTPPATIAQDGVSYVWVRVPSIPAGSADTTIWMYFDNPTASAGQDPSAVWDGSYSAVWHLKEDPTGAAPQHADSTEWGNHATAQGPISSDRWIDAHVGRGLDLDGSNDHLQVCVDDCSASLRISGSAFTLEAWARTGGGGVDNNESLIDKRHQGGDERYYLGISESDEMDCRVTTTDGHYRLSTSAIPTRAWSYIVCRYDGSLQSNQLQGWVNGAHAGSTSASGNVSDNAADDLLLGKRFNARYFDGRLDELRISSVARSDSYITAQHRAMRDKFVIYGAEETP
jgi:hypothetical protein